MVLSSVSDGRVIITPDFELQMTDIQLEKAGTYECVVVNPLSRQSFRNNVSVIGENRFVVC